MHYRVALKEY